MKHLQRDMDDLKKDILAMGTMVEDAVRKAIIALHERRGEVAREVIDGDDRIDQWEVQVEEECLKMLALHQPVAGDLRFITAVLKINNDLERMGDLAVNIAERAAFLASAPPVRMSHQLKAMTDAAMRMVRESLDAFVARDTQAARRICLEDQEVDQYHRQIMTDLQNMMKTNPETIERAMQLSSVSQRLERIADHATNIAEDIVYMADGEIIRHRKDKAAKPSPRKTKGAS